MPTNRNACFPRWRTFVSVRRQNLAAGLCVHALIEDRVGLRSDRSETVVERGKRIALDFGRRHGFSRQRVGKIARRRCGGDDGGLEAVIERRAGRRFDAHMRHEAGHNELLAAETFERFAERGTGEGVGQALFDDGLRAGRSRRVRDGEAGRPKRANWRSVL